MDRELAGKGERVCECHGQQPQCFKRRSREPPSSSGGTIDGAHMPRQRRGPPPSPPLQAAPMGGSKERGLCARWQQGRTIKVVVVAAAEVGGMGLIVFSILLIILWLWGLGLWFCAC